jgi:hypothetical protein
MRPFFERIAHGHFAANGTDGFEIDKDLLESLGLFIADWQQQLSLQLQDCEAITVAADYRGFIRA